MIPSVRLLVCTFTCSLFVALLTQLKEIIRAPFLSVRVRLNHLRPYRFADWAGLSVCSPGRLPFVGARHLFVCGTLTYSLAGKKVLAQFG